MAVCDPDEGMLSLFRGMLAEHDIVDLPRDEASMAALDQFLETRGPQLAGILVEPLVQGAGGMLLHEPEVLRRLRRLADRHGLLLIFDEIFTGFGRTGTMFAFEQAGIRPDIITLSKALTGGTLPLAATVASNRVFEAFWSDDPAHALMHGPTFMGNALACAAANASLDLFESEPRLAQAQRLSTALAAGLEPCRDLPWVRDVRVLGAIGVVELDGIADREALKRRLVEAGWGELPIAVNVSAVQFFNSDLVAEFTRAQQEFGLARGALHVELTESSLMRKPAQAMQTMQRLHEQGISVSLDDFGTGYSSMSYLQHLPLDILKIDRSFVADVETNPRNASICRALLSLGHSMGLTIIAEGVETPGQLDWLAAHGCDQVQGYLLGRPAPLEQIIDALDEVPA
ncbi:hypothetical protein G6F68_010716 [Rhizopus microsporus]|nr:hypothetical protein G6F68_010716 [Rhizopus microsporus]